MHPMHELEVLRDLVLVLAVALGVVVLLSRLRFPTIAGFLVTGALVGPGGFGLVRDGAGIEALAEVGVVLLLFTIGLEFSLARLRRIWKHVALGGSIQVVLTTAAVVGVAAAWGEPPSRGVFIGFLVALSSTAIVLRALTERAEVDAPHGRLVLGVLIFQDLCVVPMMIIVPLLAGVGGSSWEIPVSLARAAVAVLGVILLARIVLPRIMRVVAAARQRELFVLAVLVVCTTVAWGTSLLGLSLAMGAFLAGIVLADTEYGHQALADVLPFRDTLGSLFFVSVGMLLDVQTLLAEPALVLGLFAAVLLGKTIIATLAGLVMRFPPRVAVLAGVGLAQIGEFSFVLARSGTGAGLMTDPEFRVFLSVSVLTMVVTPIVVRLGPHLAAGAARLRRLEQLIGARGLHAEETASPLEGHVIVVGHGLAGRLLSAALRGAGAPYVIVEINTENVRAARAQGEPAYYGDITSVEILERAGIFRARALVILINDPDAARRAVSAARRHAPAIPIVVRSRYAAEVEELRRLGATEVIAEEVEASRAIVERVLGSKRS
jgi:CPA2 family monovalent cation:H+ antiporter-2